jgi:hypothetical protein
MRLSSHETGEMELDASRYMALPLNLHPRVTISPTNGYYFMSETC